MENLQIQKAIIFATLKHEGQKRKGTSIPYIVHPMEVMQILTEMQCTDNVVIAGILHDTLEDTNTIPSEIQELFGSDVLELVQSESEDKSKTWKERKQTTIDDLRNEDTETVLICFADKLSNLRSMYRDFSEIGNELWKRFNAVKEDIKWYYSSIIEIVCETPVNEKCSFDKSIKFVKEYKELLEKLFYN